MSDNASAYKSTNPQPIKPSPSIPLPPVPTDPRSKAFANIVAWSAHVQPGSPAPHSPQRRLSITSVSSTRRPSLSRITRRSSISHGRAVSGSFIHIIDPPNKTPSVANFDLTALGYTSVFVHLEKTPTTPSPYLRRYLQQQNSSPTKPSSPARVPQTANACASAFAHIPIPPIPQEKPVKPKGMKHFRSLSILRPKNSKSKQPDGDGQVIAAVIVPLTPSAMSNSKSALSTKAPLKQRSRQTEPSPAASQVVVKRKRAKYDVVRPPPPLANELAMMQFLDGGNMEHNVKRVMDAQAKAAAGSGAVTAVADVYRDGNNIWWDADEELEYAHLLGDSTSAVKNNGVNADMEWEEFGTESSEPLAPFMIHLSENNSDKENHHDYSRRSSFSSLDSDLDPKYLLPLPENEDPRLVPVDDRVLVSRRIGGDGETGMGAMLSLPARPRRRAMHLCKPGYHGDVRAFETASNADTATSGHRSQAQKPRGKARRRPAPLKLSNSAHGVVVVVRRPSLPLSVPLAVERARQEFMDDSFAPSPATVAAVAPKAARILALSSSDVFGSSVVSINAVSQRPPKARSKLANGVRGLFGKKAD